MDKIINEMIGIEELDMLFYKVASLISNGGYIANHCYYTGKESYIAGKDLVDRIIEQKEVTPIYEQIYYNMLWESGNIFTDLRIIKRLLLESIDFNNQYPTVELQKHIYTLWRHIGQVMVLVLSTRNNEMSHG